MSAGCIRDPIEPGSQGSGDAFGNALGQGLADAMAPAPDSKYSLAGSGAKFGNGSGGVRLGTGDDGSSLGGSNGIYLSRAQEDSMRSGQTVTDFGDPYADGNGSLAGSTAAERRARSEVDRLKALLQEARSLRSEMGADVSPATASTGSGRDRLVLDGGGPTDSSYDAAETRRLSNYSASGASGGGLSVSARAEAHALGVYDAGVGAVESAGYSFGVVGTPESRAAWALQTAEAGVSGLRHLLNDPEGTVAGWWDNLTGDDPIAIRQATAQGAGITLGVAGGMLTGRLQGGLRASASELAASEFVGPRIGRTSGFTSTEEFAEASFARYQGYVNDAYDAALLAESRGQLRGNPNTRIGDFVDRASAARYRNWLGAEEIPESVGGLVQMNRWLRDPSGSGLYVRPDIRIPGAGVTLDATVGLKWGTDTQIVRFGAFSGGDRITIVRPQQLGGSYSIWP